MWTWLRKILILNMLTMNEQIFMRYKDIFSINLTQFIQVTDNKILFLCIFLYLLIDSMFIYSMNNIFAIIQPAYL